MTVTSKPCVPLRCLRRRCAGGSVCSTRQRVEAPAQPTAGVRAAVVVQPDGRAAHERETGLVRGRRRAAVACAVRLRVDPYALAAAAHEVRVPVEAALPELQQLVLVTDARRRLARDWPGPARPVGVGGAAVEREGAREVKSWSRRTRRRDDVVAKLAIPPVSSQPIVKA